MPSKKDLAKLKDTNLIRLAKKQSDNNIRFIPSIPRGDWTTRGRAVIYFFIGEPSDYIRVVQNIECAEKKYVIPFSQLNEKSVLLRKSDNVLAYLEEYNNKPIRISDIYYQEISSFKKALYNFCFFGKTILISLLLVTCIISSLFFLVFHLFNMLTIFLSFLISVIFVVPVPYILPIIYSNK
jgi:hypothetical protein